MRALAALALLAAGCPSASYHSCPGGDWLCPNGMACAQPPIYCGTMQQVSECNGASDFTACTHHDVNSGSDVAGSCLGDVCSPCDLDRAGCSTHGWAAMTPVAQDVAALLVPGIAEAYAGGLASSPGAAVVGYRGTGWSPSSGLPAIPMDVAVVSLAGTPSDVFALAANNVFHYDGMSWRDVTPSPAPTALKGLCSVGAGKVIAVGALSTVLYYDGTWHTIAGQAGNKPYNAVWATSPTDIFVVGNAGLAAHYDGSTWTSIAVDAGYAAVDLKSVWGAASNDVYAVGLHSGVAAPNVQHYTGTSFVSVGSSASAFDMLSVWGASANDVFAVGANGQILHYDGTAWTQQPVPNATPTLGAVSGSSGSNVFVGGTGGTMWHYTGP